jgi:hypothetical protein
VLVKSVRLFSFDVGFVFLRARNLPRLGWSEVRLSVKFHEPRTFHDSHVPDMKEKKRKILLYHRRKYVSTRS